MVCFIISNAECLLILKVGCHSKLFKGLLCDKENPLAEPDSLDILSMTLFDSFLLEIILFISELIIICQVKIDMYAIDSSRCSLRFHRCEETGLRY